MGTFTAATLRTTLFRIRDILPLDAWVHDTTLTLLASFERFMSVPRYPYYRKQHFR